LFRESASRPGGKTRSAKNPRGRCTKKTTRSTRSLREEKPPTSTTNRCDLVALFRESARDAVHAFRYVKKPEVRRAIVA
jgi:hypothetical protein